MTKTNAARILDRQNIAYELVAYEVDEEDLSATSVALKLGQDVDQVFKTLVLRGDKTGIFICIVPGSTELNLKKAAHESGNKSAVMVPMKEILELTGYIRGGCSPIGMKKDYPALIDESCILFDYIFISAGVRGLQFKIIPQDLVSIRTCKLCELT